MSVAMEHQRTSTSTISNIRIPGIPSDASILSSLRNAFRREEFHNRPLPAIKLQKTEVKVTENVPVDPAIRGRYRIFNMKELLSLLIRTRSLLRSKNRRALFLQTCPPRGCDAVAQKPSPAPNSIGARSAPELVTRNDRIRRILKRAEWTKLLEETVQEVATFRQHEAEIQFQEFESYIRAEGKNLQLPEGCKPFERVLIQSSKSDSRTGPYIRFTNFCTEEDVKKYHAALSKRKIKRQYHPPLRLCYEIQRLRYLAADADIRLEEHAEETLCGKTAVIMDGDTTGRRLVTIGGVIKVENNLYAMTAGHDITSDKPLQLAAEIEPFFDASIDGIEYDDEIESALICGEPRTTPDGAEQLPEGHETSKDDQDCVMTGSASLKFGEPSMSGDDRSLHVIHDPLLVLPNSFTCVDGVSTEYMTQPASLPESGPKDAWLLAGVSGHRGVLILPGSVTFPLPSGNWISVWKAPLNNTHTTPHPCTALKQGDSGSWIVDRLNGHVFGHVIASTDDMAFLIPLTHTFDSISRQTMLKSTKDFISLPPAFDMLADLAHVYHERPGESNHYYAKLFASRALMSSTLSSSPNSKIAPLIDSFVKSYDNSQTIGLIIQNLLMLFGADLRDGLSPMFCNEIKQRLSTMDQTSEPIEKELMEAAIRDLTIALGSLPERPDIYGTSQPYGTQYGTPAPMLPFLSGDATPKSKQQASQKRPESRSTLAAHMSGALQHSTPTSDRKKDHVTLKRAQRNVCICLAISVVVAIAGLAVTLGVVYGTRNRT